jgi:hypothetical protein
MSRKTDDRLNIERVIEEFQKAEDSSPHRKGTFKIEKPFEEALDTILKVKPESKAKEMPKSSHVRQGSADNIPD